MGLLDESENGLGLGYLELELRGRGGEEGSRRRRRARQGIHTDDILQVFPVVVDKFLVCLGEDRSVYVCEVESRRLFLDCHSECDEILAPEFLVKIGKP